MLKLGYYTCYLKQVDFYILKNKALNFSIPFGGRFPLLTIHKNVLTFARNISDMFFKTHS